MRNLLFKVITGDRGKPETFHEYKVYDDGHIEGFPDNVIGAVNYHFQILNSVLGKLQRKYERSPTTKTNEFGSGASQATAE